VGLVRRDDAGGLVDGDGEALALHRDGPFAVLVAQRGHALQRDRPHGRAVGVDRELLLGHLEAGLRPLGAFLGGEGQVQEVLRAGRRVGRQPKGTVMSLLLSGGTSSWARLSFPRRTTSPSATRLQLPSNSRRLVKRYSLVRVTSAAPGSERVTGGAGAALMAW
jgi:hypothetical protein